MKSRQFPPREEYGFALLEVLVTMVILAFGLLGLLGLQGRIALAEVDSFQRAQAVLLVADMAERMNANRGQAASYVAASTIGTGDSQAPDFDCTTVAMGQARDTCEWSNALKGAGERASGDAGAMIGARGCIEQVQAPVAATCTPGIYRVTVAWQGLNKTNVSSLTCANTGLFGDEMYRRALALRVAVGLPTC